MAGEQRIEASITSVTVYTDRARVTASGELELERGKHRVIIDGLPISLFPESVRVRGRGSMAVRLSGIDVRKRFHEETPTEAVRDLEREIEAVKDQLGTLEDEAAVLDSQRQHLQGLRESTKQYAKGLAKGSMTVDDQKQLVNFVAAMDHQTREALRELESSRRELERKLKKQEAELRELQSMRLREEYSVAVDLEAMDQGTFRPQVSYDVRHANWRPLYDIRLSEDGEGQRLAVEMIAEIRQGSGQDWRGVTLEVSTARPRLTKGVPELEPWYIDDATAIEPRSRIMGRPPEPGLAAAAPAAARQRPEAEPQVLGVTASHQADTVSAETAGQDLAVSFRIPGGTDVPSDNSPHKALLAAFKLAPRFNYLSVPKVAEGVVRRVEARNDTDSPLLAGKANLFVGQDFLGSTHIDHVPRGGDLELPFGIENRIEVERKLVRRDVDKVRLRERRQLTFGYEIVLKNRLGASAQVEVIDQIPASRHEEIKVSLQAVKPEPAEKTRLGELTWKVEVPSGGELAVDFGFQVEHPRQIRVIGL